MSPDNNASRGGHTRGTEYTLESALDDANKLLQKQFGQVEQSAAVDLAKFLYQSHARDEFMKAHGEGDDISQGTPTTF